MRKFKEKNIEIPITERVGEKEEENIRKHVVKLCRKEEKKSEMKMSSSNRSAAYLIVHCCFLAFGSHSLTHTYTSIGDELKLNECAPFFSPLQTITFNIHFHICLRAKKKKTEYTH